MLRGPGRPELEHAGHSAERERSCHACRMRRARERLGLKRTQMARRLDVCYSTLQRWERDKAPVPKMALDLAERLAAEAHAEAV